MRPMNVLVTAGNTKVLIDRVRCLTNIFSGRTGTAIALHAHERGHQVTLLTSRPEAVAELRPNGVTPTSRWQVRPFDTFDDLQNLMEQLSIERPAVIVQSAAISDYLAAGVYAPAPGTCFDSARMRWTSDTAAPALLHRSAGKVASTEPELWLRLVRAPKLIDRIRRDWGFAGVLVKFKLEVNRTDADLLQRAERSRQESAADLMVANTLEDASRHAFLGPVAGQYQQVTRAELPRRLLDAVEHLAGGRGHG